MKEWFSNGYILKITGNIMLLMNYGTFVYTGFYEMVIKNLTDPPMWLAIWFIVNISIICVIFSWHMTSIKIGSTTLPIITKQASGDTTVTPNISRSSEE
jgi:hypothetical protein